MSNVLSDLFGIPNCTLIKSDVITDSNGTEYNEMQIQYNEEMTNECPYCGGNLYKHGSRTIKVLDTPFGGRPTILIVNYPRKRCIDCKKIIQPDLDWIDEKRRMTHKAFQDVAQRSLRNTFEDVGNDYVLSANTAKNVFVDFMEEKKEDLRFATPSFLGIDEIKIKKLGEITVITDLEHRTLFDMLPKRNQQTLTDYFMNLPNRDKVLWVCSDMYRPFEKTIKDALPNARWVIDHFHVVKKANEAMDEVRKQVQANLTKKERIKIKKGLAYVLRTRFKDLEPEQAEAIRIVRSREKSRPMAIAFDLKEDFFNIYDNNPTSKENAINAFFEWEKSIPEDEMFEKFRELANTVRNFFIQIFQYWDCPMAITNGYTECVNRLIRENNLKGRGYSFEVLRGRSLYRKANLKAIMDNNLNIGPEIPEYEPTFHFESANEEDDYDEYDDNYDPSPEIEFDEETGEVINVYYH